MTTLKRLSFVSLIVLGIVLLVLSAAYLMVDDKTLVAMLVQRVESVTGTRIHHGEGAHVTRTLVPVLHLDKLIVEDVDKTYQVEIDTLQLQISLPWLLLGKLDIPQLLIGDTRITMRESAAAQPPIAGGGEQPPLDLSALRMRPVLHEVRISQLSILADGDRLTLPAGRIRELSLRLGPEGEIPQLSAQLGVENETLYIDARLPNFQQALKQHQLPVSIVVEGAGIDSSLTGRLDFKQLDMVLQAEIRMHATHMEEIHTGVKDLRIPGEMSLKAQLDGTFEQLAANELSIQWAGPAESMATLTGGIENVIQLEGVDLKLVANPNDAHWLAPLLPESLGALKTATLQAQIQGAGSRLEIRGFNLKGKTADALDLSFSGGFDVVDVLHEAQAENLALRLAFNAPTTRAARALLFDDIPELGAVNGEADIRATQGDPALENVVVYTRDKEGIQVDLQGRIASFPLNPERPNRGYDLAVSMKSANSMVMAQRVGLDLPLDGPLDLRFQIEGDTQALQLNRISLSAGDHKLPLVEAQGRMWFGAWDQADPLQSIDVVVDVNGDGRLLGATIAQSLPRLVYRGHARLHTVDGQHRIDEYSLHSRKGEPLMVTQTGYAERVVLFPELLIQGVSVETTLATDDTARLNALFGWQDRIPPIGSLQARFSASGTHEKLRIDDVSLTAGQADVLLLKMNGRLGYLSAEHQWHLTDTDLAIEANSSNSQALAAALGYHTPPLGPLQALASINDREKMLGVHSLQIKVGDPDHPLLQSNGSVGDLYKFSQVQLDTRLTLDRNNYPQLTDRPGLADEVALHGDMRISDAGGALGMESLNLESSPSEALNVKLLGRYTDFSKPDTLSLDAKLQARDLRVLGILFDREWSEEGPVRISAQIIKTADNKTGVTANLIAGEASGDASFIADFYNTPPYINGKVKLRELFIQNPFDRLEGKKAAESEKKTKEEKKIKTAKRDKGKLAEDKQVFSRELFTSDWLKRFDMDVSVDIESFEKSSWDANAAQFVIALKSGQLTIDPATFMYAKGKMDMDLKVDANQNPPRVEFQAHAEGVNPWRSGDQKVSDSKSYGDANYNLDVSLSTSGNSAHELASNAQGDMYVTVEKGWLRRSMVDLLFVDLVGWAYKFGKGKRLSINCGVADYTITDGVIDTKAFFMDTDSITITGEGTIDLRKEIIDYVFIPKKKSRVILKAEPVTVKGPLADPSVKAIPVKSAALTFGTLLFAPYVFVGITAAGMVTDHLNSRSEQSVCEQYERTHKEKALEDNTPE